MKRRDASLRDFSSSLRGRTEREREAFVWPSIGAPSLSFYCRARFPPRGLMRRRQCAFLHALAYRNQWPRVTLRNGDLYRAFFSPHRVTRACRDSSPLSFFFFFPLHLCFLFLPSFLFSFLFHFFSFPLLREMRRCSERKRFLRERRTGGGEKEREKSQRRVSYLTDIESADIEAKVI